MDLEDFAIETLAAMPTVASQDAWWLRPELVPRVPDELTARELVASVGSMTYVPDFTVRHTFFYATPRAFGAVGLALLSQVLHRGPERIRVHLAESENALDAASPLQPRLPEQLILDLPHELWPRASPELSVHAYRHDPTALRRSPWAHALPPDPYALPSLWLTRLDGDTGINRDDERALLGFGSLAGTLRMASLLLDAAQPDAKQDEVVLEGEPGNRGVAPTSHQMTLVRPGGFLWQTMLDEAFRARVAP